MAIKFATQASHWLRDPRFADERTRVVKILDEVKRQGWDGIENMMPAQLLDTDTFLNELKNRNLAVANCSLLSRRQVAGGPAANQAEAMREAQKLRAAVFDRKEHEAMFKMAEENAEFYKSIGITTSGVNMPPNRRLYGSILQLNDEKFNAMVDFYNKMGEIASSNGIKFGIHNDTGVPIWLWEEIVKIMEATDPRYVGLCVDTGHILTAGGTTQTIVELMHTYAKRVVYFHLKDTIRPGVRALDPPSTMWSQRFREIGRGEIEWPLVAVEINEIGYNGWITVELDPSLRAETPVESDIISKTYIDHHIKPLLK